MRRFAKVRLPGFVALAVAAVVAAGGCSNGGGGSATQTKAEDTPEFKSSSQAATDYYKSHMKEMRGKSVRKP